MTDDSSIIFIGTPSGQTSVGSGAVLAFQPDQLGNNIKCQDGKNSFFFLSNDSNKPSSAF